MSGRDWFDYVGMVVDIATFLVTAGGLSFVISSLRQTARQQRIESGPYVRVDVGSADEDMADFHKPGVRYKDSSQSMSLLQSRPEREAMVVSAWFRNYQIHPLGMALGVSAVFLIEIADSEPVIRNVRLAYLERDKPVLVDIVRIPRAANATIRLLSLSFQDFYDLRHDHQFGAPGMNAVHGRLLAILEDGRLTAIPEGRSRGNGVDFG